MIIMLCGVRAAIRVLSTQSENSCISSEKADRFLWIDHIQSEEKEIENKFSSFHWCCRWALVLLYEFTGRTRMECVLKPFQEAFIVPVSRSFVQKMKIRYFSLDLNRISNIVQCLPLLLTFKNTHRSLTVRRR